MITKEQFISRCDDARLLHKEATAAAVQQECELTALCFLAGYRAEFHNFNAPTGMPILRWVIIYNDLCEIVTSGLFEDVAHELLAERPWEDDAPFNVFTTSGLAQEASEEPEAEFVPPIDPTTFLRGLFDLAHIYVTLSG